MGEWAADLRRGITVQVPPLVDVKLWERAQAAIASNRTSGLDRTAHDYLLLGVAVCGQCGAPIGIRAAKHYVCRGRMIARKGSEGRCAAPGVRVAAADDLAWDAIRSELEDPELDRAIAGEVNARGRPGGAVFDAEDIRITLRVPRPPAAAAHVDGSARGTARPACRASTGWGRTG